LAVNYTFKKPKALEFKYAVFPQFYKSLCAQEGNKRLGQYFTANSFDIAAYAYLVSPFDMNMLSPSNKKKMAK